MLVAQHLPGGGDERAASRKLAELAQAAMQGAVDELAAECGIRKGTNGVSSNGVTANLFFDGLFEYSRF